MIDHPATWLSAAAFASAVVVRFVFIQSSRSGAVDHYYWILASRAARTQRRVPVTIPGKYLLEDERQFYPPGFALLLSLLPDRIVQGRESTILVVLADFLALLLISLFALANGMSFAGLIALAAVYTSAPVLVAYNTQLTSRSVGNLLLLLGLISQVLAVDRSGASLVGLIVLSSIGFGGMVLTHKMTTQFFAVLWPFWVCALGVSNLWISLLPPLLGLALAVAMVGLDFMIMQWRAHADIVAFWYRNWSYLGAHQFHHSPIYGDTAKRAASAFHQPGVVGAVKHIALVLAYLPIGPLLVGVALATPRPPDWVVAWVGVSYGFALVTLLVPQLRCFGGGHLYIFNAVPAVALWWGEAMSAPNSETTVLFFLGVWATIATLVFGLRRRTLRLRQPGQSPTAKVDDLAQLIRHLQEIDPSRVAVFPTTAAERVALETDHAVFWGGHGLGFRTLEPWWPVMRRSFSEAAAIYRLGYAAIDTRWWPDGERALGAELGSIPSKKFGTWRLYQLKAGACQN